jgi:hypothetical protein
VDQLDAGYEAIYRKIRAARRTVPTPGADTASPTFARALAAVGYDDTRR